MQNIPLLEMSERQKYQFYEKEGQGWKWQSFVITLFHENLIELGLNV